MLQSMGSQRVGHDWAAEQQQHHGIMENEAQPCGAEAPWHLTIQLCYHRPQVRTMASVSSPVKGGDIMEFLLTFSSRKKGHRHLPTN